MTKTLSLCRAPDTDPFRNLAREELLLSSVGEGERILYLWQNKNTVVVGKNQNCWRECRVALLEQEGGALARRLSGGGAVYHDMGNLNFTFIARREDYSVPRQLGVVLAAVRAFGPEAERSGRNDLTVGGRKFSGSAFYETPGPCCHHGTLLIAADGEKMSRYLSVSREKLLAKSVESVRARVCNLGELCSGLDARSLSAALITAFEREYGGRVREISPELPGLGELREKYASPAWRYGERAAFKYNMERRFPWGEVQLHLDVERGLIRSCAVHSDALDTAAVEAIAPALSGRPFAPGSVREALGSSGIAGDVAALLLDSM